MTAEISPNTKAILLLTAPLILSKNIRSEKLLTPTEYKKLAVFLREKKYQPSDFLTERAETVLSECSVLFDLERLKNLLARGYQLSQAIENWNAIGIWVLSRADPQYPKKIKHLLKEDAPAVLYGCGPIALCDKQAFAVVGSRNVDDELKAYAKEVGVIAAKNNIAVVSGGARGIDQVSMGGALQAGGVTIGMLADSLRRAVLDAENRTYLQNGQLLLLSPYDPKAGFNVGNAMQRNKLIYALSEASLVVNSDFEKGGTWNGAVEQLRKFSSKPLYVRATGHSSKGLEELQKRGALPWPEPKDSESFLKVFNKEKIPSSAETDLFSSSLNCSVETEQADLSVSFEEKQENAIQSFEEPKSIEETRSGSFQTDEKKEEKMGSCQVSAASEKVLQIAKDDAISNPADLLFESVRIIAFQILKKPMQDSEFASAMEVNKTQASDWLKRLMKEGVVKKIKRPVRYVIDQENLFV